MRQSPVAPPAVVVPAGVAARFPVAPPAAVARAGVAVRSPVGRAAVAARVRPLGHDVVRLRLRHPVPLRIGDRAALRDPQLQRDTFGRVPPTEPDTLHGYTADYVEIHDSRFTDRTGLTVHPQLRHTGNPHDKVVGVLLRLTVDELDAIDEVEAAMFRRAAGPSFASGVFRPKATQSAVVGV